MPLPADSSNVPDLPAVAEPVAICTAPLVPLLVVPVENDIKPLTPSIPAFVVRSKMLPLLVATPAPVDTDIEPPVPALAGELIPADATM